MTTKDMAIKGIRALPDAATWADIEERVRFDAALDQGLAEIEAGDELSHEQVKTMLSPWLTK